MTITPPYALSPEKWLVALLLSMFFAVFAAVFLSALHLHGIVTVVFSAIIVMVLAPWLAKKLPDTLGETRARHPIATALWCLLAVAALARLAGIGLFMADPAQAHLSTYWFDPFYTHHSCFSGYWQAANVANEGAKNLYAPENYAGFAGDFKLDEFLYLPQFLLLPMTGISTGGDFEQLRAAWFALEGGALALCMLGLHAWFGGRSGLLAALLLPAAWIAAPTLLTLQLGNFHLLAIALSAIAMSLFWRGRPITGGALLGFAVFKIFPGILGIYLIATRRWAAVFYTLAFSLLYTIAAYAWFGQEPFIAFLDYQAPRIASGEAWAFLEIKELAAVVAINDSIPGIVMKLNSLDVPGMSRALSLNLAWVWTAIIIALSILSARRASQQSKLELAASWLALLSLAAFRSPFVPDHTGLFAPLWLWCLVAAGSVATRPRVVLLAAAWLALAAVLPFNGTALDSGLARLIVSSISQTVAVALCLWVVLRRPTGHMDKPYSSTADSNDIQNRSVSTSPFQASRT